MNSDHQSNKLLILVGSPRRDGNSAALAEAARHGAETAGIAAELLFLDDYIKHFLTDLRCAGAGRRLRRTVPAPLPARRAVLHPIYWYGMSAQTKALRPLVQPLRGFRRRPGGREDAHAGQAAGLAVASEETYPGAALGIVHQIQEFARYTHSTSSVSWRRQPGRDRGRSAPAAAAARTLGAEFFTRKYWTTG